MNFITKTNLKKTHNRDTSGLLAMYLYLMLFGHDNDEGGKTLNGLLALVIPLGWFIYFVVVEAIYGATFGHQGLNLKVLTIDRKKNAFTQALKRHLFDPDRHFVLWYSCNYCN